MNRDDLINEPDDADAPKWARWKAQDRSGQWGWHEEEPRSHRYIWTATGRRALACKGQIPEGHDWRETLKEVKPMTTTPNAPSWPAPSSDNTNQPEEDQDEVYELQVLTHQQRAAAVDTGKCPDGTPCGEIRVYGPRYCDDCPNRPQPQYNPDDVAFKSVNAHYQRTYRGILLDPYRIAAVWGMQGGPREQIMKKCLRFTDKGQAEQEVVDEIRSALNRWQAMLDEDAAS